MCLHEFLVIFSYPRESNYLSTAARFQSELAKMTYSFVPFSYHTWCTVILLTAEPRVVSFPGCHLSLAWPTYVGDHNSPPSWWLHIFHACSWLSLYQLLVALRTLGQLNDHLKVCKGTDPAKWPPKLKCYSPCPSSSVSSQRLCSQNITFHQGSFFLKNKQSNLSNDQTVIALSYLIWAQ